MLSMFRVEGKRLGLFPLRGKIEMGALTLPESDAVHVTRSLNSYPKDSHACGIRLATRPRRFRLQESPSRGATYLW